MSKIPIVSVPAAILRQKSLSVETIDAALIKLVNDLSDTLIHKTDPPGVGLSAIQIGVPQRVFLTYLPKDKSLPAKEWTKDTLGIEVFINPVITQSSPKLTLGGKKDKPALEGCLSIPHLYGAVPRHEWIEIEYETFDFPYPSSDVSHLSSTKRRSRFDSFPARVVQHELDHLDGILFTDHTLKAGLPLYFEDGDSLTELKEPRSLIKW